MEHHKTQEYIPITPEFIRDVMDELCRLRRIIMAIEVAVELGDAAFLSEKDREIPVVGDILILHAKLNA